VPAVATALPTDFLSRDTDELAKPIATKVEKLTASVRRLAHSSQFLFQQQQLR